jgi:hypothetical protein
MGWRLQVSSSPRFAASGAMVNHGNALKLYLSFCFVFIKIRVISVFYEVTGKFESRTMSDMLLPAIAEGLTHVLGNTAFL